jgi:hypothetical protein
MDSVDEGDIDNNIAILAMSLVHGTRVTVTLGTYTRLAVLVSSHTLLILLNFSYIVS